MGNFIPSRLNKAHEDAGQTQEASSRLPEPPQLAAWDFEPSKDIRMLISEVEADPTGIFWG